MYVVCVVTSDAKKSSKELERHEGARLCEERDILKRKENVIKRQKEGQKSSKVGEEVANK